MKNLIIIIYVIVIAFYSGNINGVNAEDGNYPIVNTRSGRVQGRTTKQLGGYVEKFLGIPFAQPPVGELRWRSPIQEKSWTDIRQAQKFYSACMQNENSMVELPPLQIQEDCLYLNVFRKTSANSTKNKNATDGIPVMLFFHGGGYALGASGFFLYDGSERLMQTEDDIIIVTSNYRLGVFGYLGGDELRDDTASGANSTGNWGFQDQRAAMEWVKESIANFGGDPNKVTIFGESAGAGSTSVHLLAPKSNGLFHRAIIESGPPMAVWVTRPLADANAQYNRVQAYLKCTNPTCLRSFNASVILDAGSHSRGPHTKVKDISWAPLIDMVELNDTPSSLLNKGLINKVPVVMGTNRNEGTILVPGLVKQLQKNKTNYNNTLQQLLGEKLGVEVAKEYLLEDYPEPAAWWAATTAFGDVAMTCPSRESARLLSKAGVPVWLYFLNHELDAMKSVLSFLHYGVFHGTDLIFVWNKSLVLFSEAEQQLAETFGKMWTSMAIHGDPTVTSKVNWPKYNETNDINLRIDIPFSIETGLKKEKCDWWKTHPFDPNNITSVHTIFNDDIGSNGVDAYNDIWKQLYHL